MTISLEDQFEQLLAEEEKAKTACFDKSCAWRGKLHRGTEAGPWSDAEGEEMNVACEEWEEAKRRLKEFMQENFPS